jgi:O-acetyl-ADP-ribose deacetylase (regulator of RNase III)
MPTNPELPTVEETVSDLHTVRRQGLAWLEHDAVPRLLRLATASGISAARAGGPDAIEALLRAAVNSLGGGKLARTAAATFGLADGARERKAQARRLAAANAYGIGVDRFRKHYEPIILGQVAEQMLKLCQNPAQKPAAIAPEPARIALTGRVGHADVRLVVHVQSVELLHEIDVIVVPANVYLEPPQRFKSSVAAAVRNAAAIKSADGQEVVVDVIADELSSWLGENGRPGLPVASGTVAPTSAGELEHQGIRRIYHVAITSPLLGTNDYYVEPVAIPTGVRNVLGTARAERFLYDPPLRSIGFPLLGAGRGGLSAGTSFDRLWPSLEADIKQHGPWEVHFVSRQRVHADLITRRLSEAGFALDRPGTGNDR